MTTTFDSVEAIAVYRGWHALEQRIAQGVEIIDFDLVPEINDAVEFSNRTEVLQRIRRLRDQVAVAGDDVTQFVRAKLNASCYYIRCLEGEEFEYYTYVRNLLGKTPELIGVAQIEEQRDAVVDVLSGFGVDLPGSGSGSRDFERFDSEIRINQDDAGSEAAAATKRFLPAVLDILGFSDLDVSHSIRFVEEDKYWVGWSSGTPGDFLLRFNFHDRHHWRRGDMEYLAIHEVCGHFVHAAIMARRIGEKALDPFIGITTVHDPHGFVGEGIADALTYFFPDDLELSEYGILAREQRNWRDYLNNNAHIQVNVGGDPEALMRYILANPFASRESTKRNLETWPTDPLMRSYQYAYGIALKYHKVFAEQMDHDERATYLRYAFSRYVTPTTLIAYANDLIGD